MTFDQRQFKTCSKYVDIETGPANLAAEFVTQTRFRTYSQYLSVFHCCIDIWVFINEVEQWKVILSVKHKWLNPAW